MKNICALLMLICCTGIAYCQPHTWLVYGTAGLAQNSNADPYQYQQGTNTSWGVAPGIGYQFNKHITMGVQVSYNHIEDIAGGYLLVPTTLSTPQYAYAVNSGISINWSAGVFFRYTQPLGQIFFLYGQVNISYLSSKLYNQPYYFYPLYNNYMPAYASYYYEPYPASASSIQLQVFPAIGAKVYKGLALNFSLGGLDYTSTHTNNEYMNSTNPSTVQLTFGRQVNFGISDNFLFRARRHKKHAAEENVPGSEYRNAEKNTTDEEKDK